MIDTPSTFKTSRIHWVVRGTGTPKDRDEVNRRDVCDCDGRVCVLEVIGVSSILSVIRKPSTLTRVLPTFDFSVVKDTDWRKWNSSLVDYTTSGTTKKWSVSR